MALFSIRDARPLSGHFTRKHVGHCANLYRLHQCITMPYMSIRPLQMRLWFPILCLLSPESTMPFDHYGQYYLNYLQCHSMCNTHWYVEYSSKRSNNIIAAPRCPVQWNANSVNVFDSSRMWTFRCRALFPFAHICGSPG